MHARPVRSVPTLLALGLLVGLAFASIPAGAVPVEIVYSENDDGVPTPTPVVLGEPVALSIPIWADPSGTPGGVVFGLQDLRIERFGDVEIAGFSCEAANACLEGVSDAPAEARVVTLGDDLQGEAVPFRIGTLDVEVVGTGGLRVARGTTIDGQHEPGPVDATTIALFTVPEPDVATLLLFGAFGIAATARLRRRPEGGGRSSTAPRWTGAILALLAAVPVVSAGPAAAQLYPSPPFDFANAPFVSRPTRLTPAFGSPGAPVPLLVVVLRNQGLDHSAWPAPVVADAAFGEWQGCTPSVARWFARASNGRLTLAPAGESQGTANDGVVLVDGVDVEDRSNAELRRMALEAADPFVDYGSFDRDGDGRIENDELVLLAVNANNAEQGGQAGGLSSTSGLDGVDFAGFSVPLADGMPGSRTTWIHEIMHALFVHRDLYGYGIGAYGIMGPTVGSGDKTFGPLGFTRGILGWDDFRVVSEEGRYEVGTGDDPLLLYAPAHGTHEYFLLENRINGVCGEIDYDAPDSGLLLTRIFPDRLLAPDHTPPVEVLAADGLRRAPACGGKALLAADAPIGSTQLTVDAPSLRQDRSIELRIRAVDGYGVSSLPWDEELIQGSIDADTPLVVALDAPTTVEHAAGDEVGWRGADWQDYWTTATSSPRSSGATEISVFPTSVGPAPATPFELNVEGLEDPIEVSAVAGNTLTLTDPLPGDVSSVARVWVDPRGNFCLGAGNTAAWDSADAATPDRVASPTWSNGLSSGIRILGIGAAAETTEVYVDLPLPGAGVFVDAPALATMDALSRPPADLHNTGDATDSIELTVVDRNGSRFGDHTATSLAAGGEEAVSLSSAPPATGPVPWGLALEWTATSSNDPTIVDRATTRIDYAFSAWPGATLLDFWNRVPTVQPDPSIFLDWPAAEYAGHFRVEALSRSRTISPIDDIDEIDVTMPRLADHLSPFIPGEPAHVPSCGPLGIQVDGPFGTEDIHVQTALVVEVEGRYGFRPPDDSLSLGGPSPFLPPGHLRFRAECPSDLAVYELTLDDVDRQRDQRYAYAVNGEIVTQVLRIPDGSLAQDLALAKQLRGLSCRGGFFPHCAGRVPGIAELRIDLLQRSLTNCVGEDCDFFAVPWAAAADFDLTLLAPIGSTVRLLDADLAVFAAAVPEGLVLAATGEPTTLDSSFPAGLRGQPGAGGATDAVALAVNASSTLPRVPGGSSDRAAHRHPDRSAHDHAAQPEAPNPASPGHTPAILDPVPEVRERFRFDIQGLEPGLYVLQVDAPADFVPEEDPVALRIEWPTDDADGDRVPDDLDNCPFVANDQTDRGGVGPTSAPDGIGDACQCGDVDGDGRVTGLDGALARRASYGLAPHSEGVDSLPGANRCDVDGLFGCDVSDGDFMKAASLGLTNGVPQTCEAARFPGAGPQAD